MAETAACHLSLPRHEVASYFRDRVDGFPLKVELAAPAAAVQGVSFHCEVVRQAPFKRHLLIAAATLAAVLAPWIVYRLLKSLRLENANDATTLERDLVERNHVTPAGA